MASAPPIRIAAGPAALSLRQIERELL